MDTSKYNLKFMISNERQKEWTHEAAFLDHHIVIIRTTRPFEKLLYREKISSLALTHQAVPLSAADCRTFLATQNTFSLTLIDVHEQHSLSISKDIVTHTHKYNNL
ncbi:MAG: hypothetical protein JEY79_14445 [Pseudodesulfovibrio sp.]|nr:hypothetical protein [Pseudodesulfovibrio sp.]